jgi:adenylate cyclase
VESVIRGKPTAAEAPPERRLAAILAAGIDRCSGRASDGDESRRTADREMDYLRRAIRRSSGTILSFSGDGLMAEFSSAADALTCALGFQADSGRRMAGATDPAGCRIAINAGEILAGRGQAGGAAISLAARLEKVAPSGGIVLPGALHDQLRYAVPVAATAIRQPALGGIPERLAVVAISADACRAWSRGAHAVRGASAAEPAGDDPRTGLAIVPFRAACAGEDVMSLAVSVTDGIIRCLGGMATWVAVSRGPAVTIRTPIDLQRLRQLSDARYILHGSVETERTMIRLTVELNEAETGRVLWSDRFTRPIEESEALREEAAPRIACAVPPLLVQRELSRSAVLEAGALSAHDLALRAYALVLQPDRTTFTTAAALLCQAETLASARGSTRFAMVCWHLMAISQGWSADAAGDARAAADAAGGLDHTDPSSLALLAHLQSVVYRDRAMACAMLDRLIDQAPYCGLAWSLKALTLAQMGEGEDALVHAGQAEAMPALGPDLAWRNHVTAAACYVAGRYAEAASWARMSAIHHPGLAANARVLAASLAVLGRLDEAQTAANRVLEIDPDFRIGAWRRRSLFTDDCREQYALRLRLAGLPE